MPYNEITIPPGKDPTEYSYHERRSELLDFAIEAGHPDMLSRTKFAERYDVDPATITRDIQALQEEIHDELSADAELITSIIYRKAIREKADKGEFMDAVEIVESWNEWLEDRGQQDKAAEKIDMELDATVESDERKALLGVDLTSFAGVDPSQMVGLDPESLPEMDADAADIPLAEADEEGETDG